MAGSATKARGSGVPLVVSDAVVLDAGGVAARAPAKARRRLGASVGRTATVVTAGIAGTAGVAGTAVGVVGATAVLTGGGGMTISWPIFKDVASLNDELAVRISLYSELWP
jgi:hypothetical protein